MKPVLRLLIVLGPLLGLLAGILLTLLFIRAAPEPVGKDTMTALDSVHERIEPIYVCPMHLEVTAHAAGTCPVCGMSLVQAKLSESEQDESPARPVVKISPEVRHNLGVRTIRVTRATLERRIEATGLVQKVIPGPVQIIKAPLDGEIRDLEISRYPRAVRAGELLFRLYADEIEATQKHYLALWSAQNDAGDDAEADTEAVLQQARQQLLDSGMTKQAVEALQTSGKPRPFLEFRTAHDGMVTAVRVEEGQSVAADALLLAAQGLAQVSVNADAFQRDAAWIRTGQTVEVRLLHGSRQVFKGVVNRAGSRMNANSRSVGFSLTFDAPSHLVQNAAYVKVTVVDAASHEALVVPREALIRTQDEDRVVLALGDGRFRPVTVEAGMESNGMTEIISGLEEGDEIVVSAQFLIDSESDLIAGFRRMRAE